MKNMHLHIPDYMWKAINEMELPGNTVTSKLLILLEKGINYYAKANKKAAKRAKQGSQIQEHNTPNPHSRELNEWDLYDEDIQHTLQIAQLRWANEGEK